MGEGELGSVKHWLRPTTLLPVGIRVELIARSAVGAWIQLVPLNAASTMEMNDGDRSTFATKPRPTAHTALVAPPDARWENAITSFSKDFSVYGL